MNLILAMTGVDSTGNFTPTIVFALFDLVVAW